MNLLLIVIPFSVGDAPLAERLCDFIFHLNGRQPEGHCLLVPSPDVHGEMIMKVKLSAEVAFATVDICAVTARPDTGKVEGCNHLFKHAAAHVQRHYRCPWFYMEADCVPLKKGWQRDLLTAYHNQPRRFIGPHLKFPAEEGKERLCLARTSVYPPDAAADLTSYCDSLVTFEILAAEMSVVRSTKSRLIQFGKFGEESELSAIRTDAVVFNGDKSGRLIRLISEAPGPSSNGTHIPVTFESPKLDMRTKAGRMLKAQQVKT
jgi:hypothetical protein